MSFDWGSIQHTGQLVDCVFAPRASFDGRELKPGAAEAAGTRLKLEPLWHMDDDDPYPGEWALGLEDMAPMPWGTASDHRPLWVASGDVQVQESQA